MYIWGGQSHDLKQQQRIKFVPFWCSKIPYTLFLMYEEACSYIIPDVNECAVKGHRCHNHTQCYNTPGDYLCKCNVGFSGKNNTCTGKFLMIICKLQIIYHMPISFTNVLTWQYHDILARMHKCVSLQKNTSSLRVISMIRSSVFY